MPIMKLYAVQGYSLKASYPTGQTRQQLLYPIESLASEAYAWQFVGSCEHDLQARQMIYYSAARKDSEWHL